MYLLQDVGNVPYLSIRTNEPNRLAYWSHALPVQAISEVYELDDARGIEWHQHFNVSIVGPNSAVTGSAEHVAQLAHNINRSDQLFNAWMQSSENMELFKTVKLSAIERLSSTIYAAMLIDDVYCLNCDEQEPAFIYLHPGPGGSLRFHPSYAKLTEMLDQPLFGYPNQGRTLDVRSCHVCRPDDSLITENMLSWARRRFSTCKCAPCRGRL